MVGKKKERSNFMLLCRNLSSICCKPQSHYPHSTREEIYTIALFFPLMAPLLFSSPVFLFFFATSRTYSFPHFPTASPQALQFFPTILSPLLLQILFHHLNKSSPLFHCVHSSVFFFLNLSTPLSLRLLLPPLSVPQSLSISPICPSHSVSTLVFPPQPRC